MEAPDYTAAGAAPILVIGTTGDPATPFESAEKLADPLESGVLLVREGEGHTAYFSGNQCITDTVNTHLLDGTAPDDGTVCGEDSPDTTDDNSGDGQVSVEVIDMVDMVDLIGIGQATVDLGSVSIEGTVSLDEPGADVEDFTLTAEIDAR